MTEDQFTLLRRFQYSSEAIIYQGKLESQGIPVFLRDITIIDSNPLYSNAVGGIKLFVKTEDVSKATEILNDVSLFSVDDDNKLIKCPKCKAEQTNMITSIKDWKSFLAFIFAWILTIFPIYSKYKYQCQICKHEFNK